MLRILKDRVNAVVSSFSVITQLEIIDMIIKFGFYHTGRDEV